MCNKDIELSGLRCLRFILKVFRLFVLLEEKNFLCRIGDFNFFPFSDVNAMINSKGSLEISEINHVFEFRDRIESLNESTGRGECWIIETTNWTWKN